MKKNIISLMAILTMAMGLSLTPTYANDKPQTIGAVQTTASVDEQVVDVVLGWIKSLHSLSVPLVQINADGSQMQGQMDVYHTGTPTDKTRGKMRLTYKNSPQYLVADGYWLWVVDTELGSRTAINIKDTPAWFLLQPKGQIKRYGDTIMVSQAGKIDSLYRIKLQSIKNPDDGFLILWYDPATNLPVRWQVSDQQGGITTVIFGIPETKPRFPKNYFKKPNFGN